MIVSVGALLCACNNDNDKPSWRVPQPVVETLREMYPTASNINWFTSGAYTVARFRTSQGGGAVQHRWAWFDGAGTWYMTETDVTSAQMPRAVQTAFAESAYGAWTFEDGDWLERAGLADIYVIEAKGTGNNRDTDVALYYTAGGTLVKTVFNPSDDYHYGDMLPALLPVAVSVFIQSEYPAAQIINSYMGDKVSRVEILDEGVVRTVWFDGRNDWLYTVTAVEQDDLPANVATALAESAYASYTIRNAYFYNAPTGDFYRLSLQSAGRSVEVDITPDGALSVAGEN